MYVVTDWLMYIYMRTLHNVYCSSCPYWSAKSAKRPLENEPISKLSESQA